MKGYPNAHLLVSADELSRATGEGGTPLLLIDLRPPDAFASGHIPGAVHLDLFGVSLIDTDPAPLKAFMWMIEHLFATRGVDVSTPVVVYDEQSGIRAARAFWFLEYFGHPAVRLLDGGFGAWSAAGLPVSRDAAPAKVTEWKGNREQKANTAAPPFAPPAVARCPARSTSSGPAIWVLTVRSNRRTN